MLKKYTQDQTRESESIILCELEKCIASIHQSWNSTQKLRKIHLITKNHFYEANLNDFSLLKDGNFIELTQQSPLFSEHEALLKLIDNQPNHLASTSDALQSSRNFRKVCVKLVLFLNMGGATNLQDCEVFLKNMFNDPYILGIKNRFLRKFVAWIITKARVKAMQENYKKMGGKSPLNELTQSLCDKQFKTR